MSPTARLPKAPFALRAFPIAIVLSGLACRHRAESPTPNGAPPARLVEPPEVGAAAGGSGPPADAARPPHAAVDASGSAPAGFRFAVIGDYGASGLGEQRVAALVKAFAPEVIITLGDNNYPKGGASTIDENIGRYYSDFIGDYHGRYGPGAKQNRFFPSLGNHDWYSAGARPYLDYFSLPGNERYYTFSSGPVDFFALDSDTSEPDGNGPRSKQAQWFREAAAQAKGAWQIAYMHRPPYSSGPHGSAAETRWGYAEAGIDLVLSGHDHIYERAVVAGLTYLVNGLGGAPEYSFTHLAPGSQFRYQAAHGAQLAVATPEQLSITFVNVDGVHVDEVVLKHTR